MKKIMFALFVLILLLVSGCGNDAGEVVDKKTTEGVSSKTTDLGATDRPDVKDISSEPVGPILTKDIKDLKAKANTVSSIEYTHNEFVDKEQGYQATVYLKGTKMKHEVDLQGGTYLSGTFYETAYFDDGKVEAYCESERCRDSEELITSDPSLFSTITPFTILEEMTVGTNKGSALYEDREVVMIEYELKGKMVTVFVWDYKGIPLKYEVRNSDDKIIRRVEFLNLVINDVKDSDLIR